ncbi:MAG: hypothetical protein LBU69_06215 [Deltaproteobacteria bacterium]|jgi:hypothetical protein|nr:hypothetical protein [Deltaproteobacteria bacterium]
MKSANPEKAAKKGGGLFTRASASNEMGRRETGNTLAAQASARQSFGRTIGSGAQGLAIPKHEKRATQSQHAGATMPRRSSPKQPVIMRGGVVYPIPSRKILESMRKGYPDGLAIKAFREAINLNVRDFAFFVGVDPATVFRWETRRTCKLQLGSMSKVMKLVNCVAAGKPVKIPILNSHRVGY